MDEMLKDTKREVGKRPRKEKKGEGGGST